MSVARFFFFVLLIGHECVAAEWIRIGPDWRDEKPQSTTAVIPFRNGSIIVDVNLNQRLNQFRWHASKFGDSGRSLEIGLYNAVIDRETNDFPRTFNASLTFNVWESSDKKEGELLGSIEGPVYLNPAPAQSPINSTLLSRTIAGKERVVFIYEWDVIVPLRKVMDQRPVYVEVVGGCSCGPYEAGIAADYNDTLLIYTLGWVRNFSTNAVPSESPQSSFNISDTALLPTNIPPRIRLSVLKEGASLRILASPASGTKVLERMTFDQVWKWEEVDRTTHEKPTWRVLPRNDGTAFRVRLE